MECNMAHTVKALLDRQNAQCGKSFKLGFIDQYPDVGALPPGRQITLLNAYWHRHLASLPTDTIEVRMSLLDDVSVTDWLSNFEQFVVPTVRYYPM